MTEPADTGPERAPRAVPIRRADLYDRVPCGLLTMGVDGTILRVNATFSAWTGLQHDELITASFTDLLEPGARIFYETRFIPSLLLEGEIREIALSICTADQRTIPVLINARLEVPEQTQPLIQLAVFDASQRQDYERQLLAARRSAEASEARTRVLQDATDAFGSSETVEALAQALADSARAALGATAAAVFLDDYEPQLAGGTVPLDGALMPGAVPPESLSSESQLRWSTRNGDDDVSIRAALRAARLEAMLVAPLLHNATIMGTVACYFAREPDLDIHNEDLVRSLCRQAAQTVARLRLQMQLSAIALYDPLTGLANRILLRDHITASVSAAIAHNQPLALIFVDLDDFKSINDELDHTAGDTVLKLVASRLTAAVRSEDLVCRYGGDEFIIVCRDTDQDHAAAIAERIRVAVKQPLYTDGWQRTITASVGVTVHTSGPSHALNGPELLRVADKAMYRSKNRGKDQVSFIAF